MRDQMGFACVFLRETPGQKSVSFGKIAAFFSVDRHTVHHQYQRYNSVPKPPGRPRFLPDEAFQYIENTVAQCFQHQEPVSYQMLLEGLQRRFGINLLSDTLRHICRTMPGVKSVRGVPMDKNRVHCDQAAVAAFYDELEAVVEEVPAEFIWNIDETGCDEWVDKAREYRVLVPDDYQDDWIHVAVDRHSKHSTLVGCIAADGSSMRPMIVVDRVTMEADLKLSGYDEDKLLMVSQPNAFMTTVLFEKWADEVFFPSIEERRRRTGYQGPCVLVLDGPGSHHSDAFLAECEDRNIYVIFLVPHSSDQCQPLDLITFALLKRYFRAFSFDQFETKQTNKVVKMMGAWYQATAPHQVVSAWTSMGIVPVLGPNGQRYVRVDRLRARAVRGWGTEPPVNPFGQAGLHRIRLATA
jgi:hypothetical protein